MPIVTSGALFGTPKTHLATPKKEPSFASSSSNPLQTLSPKPTSSSAKKKKKNFYAVAHGRNPGIYTNYLDMKRQIYEFPNARFKGFETREEAEEWIEKIHMKNPEFKNASSEAVEEDDLSDRQHIYTDGSRMSGGAGYACVFVESDTEAIVVYGNVTLDALDPTVRTAKNVSNNRAELTAILRAVEISLKQFNGEPSVVFSDSNYCISTLTQYLPGWRKKFGDDTTTWVNSAGKIPANLDLLLEIERLINAHGNVLLRHVFSHVGNTWNDQADLYAKKGIHIQGEKMERIRL